MMCRIHTGYRWISVCVCTQQMHTHDCCDFQCLYSMHSLGPAVIAVKCLQNRWLIRRPHERHYQPRMPRIRQNAKEALRTSEACDARCYRQTQGEKPISLLGVGSGRGAQKLQHDWLAIAVSRLCSFVMIKSQHSQHQHVMCVVMWMLRLRKRDHNTNKNNILIRSLMCLFRLHRLMGLASLRFNVPRFAYMSFHSVADYVWSYPLVPKHSVWQIRSLFSMICFDDNTSARPNIL